MSVIPGQHGQAPVASLGGSAPAPGGTTGTLPGTSGSGSGSATGASAGSTSSSTPVDTKPGAPVDATAFPFALPAKPGPGGTQALAENTTDGGVRYDVAYALVTVSGGADVTNTNSAYALAHCNACTTVAVSFQVVLIVGQSKVIAPINAAGALNYNCPACVTTALADQIVVTLKAQPSAQLLATLTDDLKQLNALPALGAAGRPNAVASEVSTVQNEIDSALQSSGLETNPPSSTSTSTTAAPPTTTPVPTTSTAATTVAPPASTSTSTTTSTTPTSTSSTSTSTTSTTSTMPSTASTDTTSTTSTTPGG